MLIINWVNQNQDSSSIGQQNSSGIYDIDLLLTGILRITIPEMHPNNVSE